jgi:circadian clock protein KaiB
LSAEPIIDADTSYELTLFVSGASELSARAVSEARQLCEGHLAGRAQLTVIDVHQDPAAALSGRVLVTPTLVKKVPLPVRRFVGELSRADQVLRALQLPAIKDASNALS